MHSAVNIGTQTKSHHPVGIADNYKRTDFRNLKVIASFALGRQLLKKLKCIMTQGFKLGEETHGRMTPISAHWMVTDEEGEFVRLSQPLPLQELKIISSKAQEEHLRDLEDLDLMKVQTPVSALIRVSARYPLPAKKPCRP